MVYKGKMSFAIAHKELSQEKYTQQITSRCSLKKGWHQGNKILLQRQIGPLNGPQEEPANIPSHLLQFMGGHNK
jgi:hypothetical protein